MRPDEYMKFNQDLVKKSDERIKHLEEFAKQRGMYDSLKKAFEEYWNS